MMNSRERIQAVMAGQKPDRTPIFPKIAFSNVLARPGMRVIDYMTDPACMAEACLAARDLFGWDGVALHTDIASEGMALGSVYNRPENSPAELRKPLLSSLEEYEKVKTPDPWATEPMRTVLAAVKLVRERAGSEVYIAAWTNGPLNVASQVLAIDELLIGLLTEPELVHCLLRKCVDVAMVYARELVAAGADAVAFGHATASATMLSRDHYREFALPYETELVAAIHAAGAGAITHICGNIVPNVDLIAQNGSEVIDFDHVCDVRTLRDKAPGKILRGNLDPTLLALGKPEQIREAVRTLMERAGRDPLHLLGSGCEIALNTPPENLHVFVDACREFATIY